MKTKAIFLAMAMLAFFRPADANWRIDDSAYRRYLASTGWTGNVSAQTPCQYATQTECQNAILAYARQMGNGGSTFANMSKCVECGGSNVSPGVTFEQQAAQGLADLLVGLIFPPKRNAAQQAEIERQKALKLQQEKEQKEAARQAANQAWTDLQFQEQKLREIDNEKKLEAGKDLLGKMETIGGGELDIKTLGTEEFLGDAVDLRGKQGIVGSLKTRVPGDPQKLESVITNCSGSVSIQKKSGEIIDFGKNQDCLLEKGDEIITHGDSSAELQFLEGRGTMKVGPDSRVRMEEDNADAQVMSMLKGKVDISVEKFENFQKTMEEKIKAYKEDLKTVNDEIKQKIVDEYYKFKYKLKLQRKWNYAVRTPSCVIGVRGTRFLVYEDEKKGTEVIVLEGSVEIKSKIGNTTVLVNEGHKVVAAKGGKLSEPEKIDLSDLDRRREE